MLDVKAEVKKLNQELITLRRDFHMNPELGYQEHRTSQIVYDYLVSLGLEVKKITKTGVAGVLRGSKEGKTLMLRADMDALPQYEKTGLPYQSLNKGIMHACGHDGHTAILLITAKILAKYRDEINGNVKFVFQPNEEQAGALDMIKEGVLEDPKVDAAVGLHLWTPIESGKIGINSGPVMAATVEFELEIIGRSGHTSAPHTAKDPILAATSVVQNLQSIETRETDPLAPIAIMVGRINGGSARNIISGKVQMGGTIRFLFENEKKEKVALLERVKRVVDGTCQAMGVDYNLRFIPSNSSLYNDVEIVEFIKESCKETFNTAENLEKYICLAGEDFAEFSHKVPSAFYFVGTGNNKKNTHYPHHHPMFDIDEDTMKYGVEINVRTALNFLKQI